MSAACRGRVRMRPVAVDPVERVLREEFDRELRRMLAIQRVIANGTTDPCEIAAATGYSPAAIVRSLAHSRALLRERDERVNPPAPPSDDELLDRAKWAAIEGPDGVTWLRQRGGVDVTTWGALVGAGMWRVGDVELASDETLLALPYVGPGRVRRVREAIAKWRAEATINELEQQFRNVR